jgi:AraC-like DNA-binding protein
MPNPVTALRSILLSRLAGADATTRPLGGVGVFHSHIRQSLRAVPIHHPTVVMILAGRKELHVAAATREIQAGELLLVPGNSSLHIGNIPDPVAACYLALAVSFPPTTLEHFRRLYGANIGSVEQRAVWSAAAPDDFARALQQWLAWCVDSPPDAELALHRHTELLLLLVRAGCAGNLLLDNQLGWRQRVSQLVSCDLSHAWDVPTVCRRLAVGESSLRRYLREEGTGFREVLEEARLVAGLGLLQETYWPVARIAAEVGYDSPSRFAERFKLRFGLTPTQLKMTRMSDSGERTSVCGEKGRQEAVNITPPLCSPEI